MTDEHEWPKPSTSDLPTWPHLKSDEERMAKIKHHLAIGLGPVPAPWVEWLLTKLPE